MTGRRGKAFIVRVRTSPSYPVYIGDGILPSLSRLLARHASGRRAVILIDARLKNSYGRRIAASLQDAGRRIEMKVLPSGEGAKSLSVVQGIYSFLLRRRADRRTPLIAVGGGAVGDAAGFAAATYHRGIALVHVPTTLVGQVDSSLGGKTAVNHPLAKNAVGAFHQPLFVLADVACLRTLPRRDFLAGMGEVVKYALGFDRSFARALASDWRDILRRRSGALLRVVRRCARIKAGIVAADERDVNGRRELLNLGHTIGHALEAAAGYRRFKHGEAVAWGMRAAVELSRGRGWMSRPADLSLAEGLLTRLPSPAWPGGLASGPGGRAFLGRVLRGLRRDKKVSDGSSRFILLRGLADPIGVSDAAPAEIRAALFRVLQ